MAAFGEDICITEKKKEHFFSFKWFTAHLAFGIFAHQVNIDRRFNVQVESRKISCCQWLVNLSKSFYSLWQGSQRPYFAHSSPCQVLQCKTTLHIEVKTTIVQPPMTRLESCRCGDVGFQPLHYVTQRSSVHRQLQFLHLPWTFEAESTRATHPACKQRPGEAKSRVSSLKACS